jgi:hypothetical protein
LAARCFTLARGNSELHLMGVQTMERLIKEIEDFNWSKIYSKSDWARP